MHRMGQSQSFGCLLFILLLCYNSNIDIFAMPKNGHTKPSVQSESFRPVFSEDDGTSYPDKSSTGWPSPLDDEQFLQVLLGEAPPPDTYNGERLSEILAAGENTIICSRICGSVANAIGEFAGRFILEGPPSTQDVVNDYISKCHSKICAVSNWSQQLHLGPDSSCYRLESLARCTEANRLSVLVRAVPVQASVQVCYIYSPVGGRTLSV